MDAEFERQLAFHGGPALAGIKAANLVSFAANRYPKLPQQLADYARPFNQRGIYLDLLGADQSHFLLLIYRQEVLWRHLALPQIREILCGAGYPATATPEDLLAQLRRRLAESASFPHEIGAFLGYPPQDVAGFVRYQGKGYKYKGQWKVYGDVVQAKACFARYDRCRRRLCQQVAQGVSLVQLFCPSLY